jgi:hypothetical protein
MKNIINEMIATGVATLTAQIEYYTNRIAQSEQSFIRKALGESIDSYSLEAHAKGLVTMRGILAEYQRALNELQPAKPKRAVKQVKRGRPRK